MNIAAHHVPNIFTKANADALVAILTADDEDGWTYEATLVAGSFIAYHVVPIDEDGNTQPGL